MVPYRLISINTQEGTIDSVPKLAKFHPQWIYTIEYRSTITRTLFDKLVYFILVNFCGHPKGGDGDLI